MLMLPCCHLPAALPQGRGVRVLLGQPPAAAASRRPQPLCHPESHPAAGRCAPRHLLPWGLRLLGQDTLCRMQCCLCLDDELQLYYCISSCTAEGKVYRRLTLSHPVFSFASDKAQRRLPAAQVCIAAGCSEFSKDQALPLPLLAQR